MCPFALFIALVSSISKLSYDAYKYQALAQQIIHMAQENQELRKHYLEQEGEEAWYEYCKAGHKHKRALLSIIEKYGWPTDSLVGHKAATAAWFIAQHHDNDVIFQRMCFGLMQKAKALCV